MDENEMSKRLVEKLEDKVGLKIEDLGEGIRIDGAFVFPKFPLMDILSKIKDEKKENAIDDFANHIKNFMDNNKSKHSEDIPISEKARLMIYSKEGLEREIECLCNKKLYKKKAVADLYYCIRLEIPGNDDFGEYVTEDLEKEPDVSEIEESAMYNNINDRTSGKMDVSMIEQGGRLSFMKGESPWYLLATPKRLAEVLEWRRKICVFAYNKLIILVDVDDKELPEDVEDIENDEVLRYFIFLGVATKKSIENNEISSDKVPVSHTPFIIERDGSLKDLPLNSNGEIHVKAIDSEGNETDFDYEIDREGM